MRIITGDDDVLEIRTLLDEFFESRKERLRHDQAFRAAVGQHETVIVFRQKRVDWHRDDSGLQAAEKCGRPVDGIEQRNQYAFFAFYPEAAQRSTKTRNAVGQLAISVCAARIDIGRLVGTARRKIAPKNIGGKIVVAWDYAHRLCRDRFCRAHLRD